MNHMAVMYRKNAVLSAGSYIEVSLAEDYYLWVRMFQKGYYAININQTLVNARVGNGMYTRRGGWAYAKKICSFQYKIWKVGFISFGRLVANCVIRGCVIMAPGPVRRYIYVKRLHQI